MPNKDTYSMFDAITSLLVLPGSLGQAFHPSLYRANNVAHLLYHLFNWNRDEPLSWYYQAAFHPSLYEANNVAPPYLVLYHL